jgi:hypothetical protein
MGLRPSQANPNSNYQWNPAVDLRKRLGRPKMLVKIVLRKGPNYDFCVGKRLWKRGQPIFRAFNH